MYQVQKKKSGWFYVTLFLCAFAVGLGIGYAGIRSSLRKQKTPPAENTVTQDEENPAVAEPNRAVSVVPTEEKEEPAEKITYFVQARSGKVCVFAVDASGTKRFSHNLAITLDALREADRALFDEGIEVASKEELSSLVEDFGS